MTEQAELVPRELTVSEVGQLVDTPMPAISIFVAADVLVAPELCEGGRRL